MFVVRQTNVLRSRRWALVSDLPEPRAQSYVHTWTLACDGAPTPGVAECSDVVSGASTSCAYLVAVSTFRALRQLYRATSQSTTEHHSQAAVGVTISLIEHSPLSLDARAVPRYNRQAGAQVPAVRDTYTRSERRAMSQSTVAAGKRVLKCFQNHVQSIYM